MTDPSAGPAPSRSPLWLRVLLIASLALNVLVIAAVVGAAVSGPGRGAPSESAMRQFGFGPYGAALNKEQRRDMRGRVFEERRNLRQALRSLGATFDELQILLRAETLDRAEMERLLAEQRRLTSQLHGIGHGFIIESVADMSAEERAAYADRLKDKVPRRGRFRGSRSHRNTGD